MTLPNTNATLTQFDLYPDRITLCAQYACPENSGRGFWTTVRALHTPEIRRHRMFVRVSSDELGDFTDFRVHRGAPGAPIVLTADINPLAELHRRRTDYGNERAYDDRAQNWLHPDDVSASNSLVRSVLAEMLVTVERRGWHLANQIVSGLPREPDVPHWEATELLNVSIAALELAVDVGCLHPGFTVERLAKNLTGMVPCAEDRVYPNQATIVRGAIRDAHMVSGHRRREERYKIYDKTNERIRIEVRLTPKSARGLGVIFSLSDANVCPLIDQAAAAVLPYIQRLLSSPAAASDQRHSPLQALATIGQSTRDRRKVEAVFLALSSIGRMTTTGFDRQLCERLSRSGLVARTERGIYTVTPSYEDAFTFLAVYSGVFFKSAAGGGR